MKDRKGFRITVECLDDKASSSFLVSYRDGVANITPDAAGRKVASVLAHYRPWPEPKATAARQAIAQQ